MPDGFRISRVLMTADAVGGVWSYAIQLATLLAARGVEVVLATMGPEPSADQSREATAVPNLKLHTSSFALEWMPDPWDDVNRAGTWLLDLEREVEPDVVHLNGFAHATLPFRAPVLVVAHSCVSSWWEAVKSEPLPREWTRYVDTVRSGLASASRIAAPTRAMRDALVRCYGVGHDAAVIPNARTVERGRSRQKQALVLAVARGRDPAQNMRALDDAAAGLPWPVKVIGETAPLFTGDERLRHVIAPGPQTADEMKRLMCSATIFAHPARYEPFGLSVLDAALARCALVLGDIDTLRENWAGSARFVSPDDPTALRDTILALIADPAERDALAAAAERRAELFSPQLHRDAYYDLYAAMVAERRALGATRSAAAPSSTGSRA